jgi:hypothetical protein
MIWPAALSFLVPALACSAHSGGVDATAAGGTVGVGTLIATASGGTDAVMSAAGGSAPAETAVGNGGDPAFIIPPPPIQVKPMDSCASAAFESHLLPTNLLFLVDRSGSMNCNLPPLTDSMTCEQNPVAKDPSQPTKWSVITDGLSKSFNELSAVADASAGLTFFSNDDVCGVTSTPNVPLGPMQKPQIDALTNAMMNAKPSGGTPIVGAIILGYKHLHQQALAPGNRFVVLVTDGSDSCLDMYSSEGVTGDVVSRLLNTEIPNAIAVNIRTFVIGAPGSEPSRGLLSKIAFLGGTARDPNCDHTSDNPMPGTACHFDMTQTTDFAKDLGNALQNVTSGTALTCDFDVPMPSQGVAVDPNLVNVDYYKGGDMMTDAAHVALSRDDTKPCDMGAQGWQYIDNKTKIRICGMVCDQVRADATAKVIVSLGCPPRVVTIK